MLDNWARPLSLLAERLEISQLTAKSLVRPVGQRAGSRA